MSIGLRTLIISICSILMFRDDGEVFKRFAVAGVYEAVRVAAGTVVTVALCEVFLNNSVRSTLVAFASVVEAAGDAGSDKNYFAVGLVLVVADGAANVEVTLHNLVQPIEEAACPRLALTPFKVRHHGYFNILKVNYHGIVFC